MENKEISMKNAIKQSMIMMIFGLALVIGFTFLNDSELARDPIVSEYNKNAWEECSIVEDIDLKNQCKQFYRIPTWLTKEQYFERVVEGPRWSYLMLYGAFQIFGFFAIAASLLITFYYLIKELT